MPIYFRTAPVTVPFLFETVGDHWRQSAVQRPSGHPYYHYLQTETGRGHVQVRGNHYILEGHEGLLLAPGVPHSYFPEKGEDWVVSFVTFTGTLQSGISSMVHGAPETFVGREQGRHIGPMIARAADLHRERVTDPRALSACCYGILLCFAEASGRSDVARDPLYLRYVAPVIKEIETRYPEELTVGDLSRLVFVSPQYLSRLFRRFLGQSVYGYLTMYRITRAKEFLYSRPHSTVQEVARDVGYTDASHFIGMFKKATGCTPMEFRKMY